MMSRMLSILHFSLLSLLAANAANAAFTFQDQPISPDCLAALAHPESTRSSVDMRRCSSLAAAKKVHLTDGLYTTRNDKSADLKPFANYAVIGEQGGKFLVGFGQWTGGSGFFTTIMWLSKKNNDLKLLKVLAGGDRCNGGTYKAGEWQYTVNLTSTDMIDLADNKSIKIKAYEDLDASAAGCVAKAQFTFDPKTAAANLMTVVLDKEINISGDWAKQFKYQVCFNTIFDAYLAQDKQVLSLPGVKDFARQFQQKCLPK